MFRELSRINPADLLSTLNASGDHRAKNPDFFQALNTLTESLALEQIRLLEDPDFQAFEEVYNSDPGAYPHVDQQTIESLRQDRA